MGQPIMALGATGLGSPEPECSLQPKNPDACREEEKMMEAPRFEKRTQKTSSSSWELLMKKETRKCNELDTKKYVIYSYAVLHTVRWSEL